MKTKSVVITKFGVPGFHRWSDAPEEVAHLRASHRHIFSFRIGVHVDHNNRDVEFQLLQTHAMAWITDQPQTELGVFAIEFGEKSCEHIATMMIEYLNEHHGYHVAFVEVFEDDENGARVEVC